MPKNPTPTIPDDHPCAIDDDTFDELAADEERLNASLENPQTIRTGEATSIAKTKPRRSTVGRTKPIVLLPPDSWGTSDEALNGPATTDYDLVALDQQEDEAQSFSLGQASETRRIHLHSVTTRRWSYDVNLPAPLKIGLKNFGCLLKPSYHLSPLQRGLRNNTRDVTIY